MDKKVALITGASQGIGKAIAITLAAQGFDIAVNARDEQNLPAAEQVAELCREKGARAECFVADVSDFAACERMVQSAAASFGHLDVLVNNAGITRDGLIARMSEEQYDSVIAVNQKSVFNMLRQVTPIMMKQRYGRIINMASVAGLYGNPGQLNYSASKAAILGMTYSAAKELGGRGITVNAVAPGFIATDMTGSMPEKTQEAILGMVTMKRPGQPEDVANAVAFFADERTGYITGQVLCVDGGLMM